MKNKEIKYNEHNHYVTTQKRDVDKDYKNHYKTVITYNEINQGTITIGDTWINKADYEILKNYTNDCYFWYLAGSCSPTSSNNKWSTSCVDGYEIHLLTDKDIEYPWQNVDKYFSGMRDYTITDNDGKGSLIRLSESQIQLLDIIGDIEINKDGIATYKINKFKIKEV